MSSLLLSVVLAATPPDLGTEASAAAADRAPATIGISLPADAKLTFDGQATQSTSGHRLFTTPPLERGKTFHYSVRAEFVRAGRMITVQQDISVEAGRETFVSLDIPKEALGQSFSSGEYAYTYGASPETGYYYYRPQSFFQSAAPRFVPSGGFSPPHWGTEPSDPLYHSGQ